MFHFLSKNSMSEGQANAVQGSVGQRGGGAGVHLTADEPRTKGSCIIMDQGTMERKKGKS